MIDGDALDLFETSLRHATETATGDALDAALRELGWFDAFAVDRHAAVSLLFELQGSAGATSSALAALMAASLGVEVARGPAPLLPPLGRTDAPGQVHDGRVDVFGIAWGSVATREEIAVALVGGEGIACIRSDALEARSVGGLDPALGLVELRGAAVPADVEPGAGPTAWADAVALGQLALAHELVGASRAMLALARDHAVERIQFGQPIARFQAVRHRLADAYVAIEAAEAATVGAWDDGSSLAAAVAKAVAGRNARLVARHCQQVLAGIGFTNEHRLPGYVRRVLVLDRLLGDARSLTATIGAELLRTRRVPSLLPL